MMASVTAPAAMTAPAATPVPNATDALTDIGFTRQAIAQLTVQNKHKDPLRNG